MCKKTPIVSIIMPAYNAEKTIVKSLESVLNQSFEDWELLITDDNSTDSTKDIILRYVKLDNRIKYFLNSGVNGAWSARNNSLRKVSGKFVAFLDSDDMWYPAKLALQLEAIDETGESACHSAYDRVNVEGLKIGYKAAKKLVTFEDMLKKNEIGNLTGIYDREKLGVFFQQAIGHEDYAMWLKILKNTNSVGVQMPLASYRVDNTSLSANKLQAAKWHFNILKNQDNVNYFNIWYYFFCYTYNALKLRV